MAERASLVTVIEDRRTNAALSWLLVCLTAAASVRLLLSHPTFAVFGGVIVALALVPPLTFRRATVMLPWEVLGLGAAPVLGRALSAALLTSETVAALSVAAVALVVAVELDVFTPVRMPPWFAVLFVVIGTMAAAGAWAVVRWLSDLYLGTTFVLVPGLSDAERNAAVMWDFAVATGAGLFAGLVFEWYFRRLARSEARLPDEVREVVE